MPVIGLNFKSMEGRKNDELSSSIKVNSNMNIKDVKEQELPVLNKKGLLLEFEFKVDYIGDKNKSLGEINITGEAIALEENQEKIVKDWKKDEKLPDNLRFQVVRLISDKCSKKAIILSDDLQLPPPPLIMPQAKQENK